MRINIMRKRAVRGVLSVLLGLAVLAPVQSFRAMAYYNLGTVDLTLGSTSVTLAPGESVTVSATATPPSSDQTPSCGDARCPQTCPAGCADKNGQCMCAGAGYSTYYASVSATTGSSQIASANYSNGTVTIRGLSVGTTTISVAASLREWTSSPTKTIQVTVAKKSTPNTGGAGDSAAGGGSGGTGTSATGVSSAAGGAGGSSTAASAKGGSSSGAQSASAAGSSASSAAASSAASAASSGAAASSTASSDASASSDSAFAAGMDGQLGKSDIVQLPADNVSGKEELSKIEGQADAYATFQKKDEVGNVLYSWLFNGKDVTAPADFDMGVTFSGGDNSSVKALANGASLVYLNFAHHGALPGKATVSVRVSDTFKDGQTLYFYYYDPEKKSAELMAQGVKVVNGYADLTITHCSSYFLSAKAVGAQSGFPAWAIVVIVFAVWCALYFGGFLFVSRRMRRNEAVPAVFNKIYLPFMFFLRQKQEALKIGAAKENDKDEAGIF